MRHGEEIDSKGKKHTFVIPDDVHYEGPFDTEDEALEKLYEEIFVFQ